jgi:hypothetical protein
MKTLTVKTKRFSKRMLSLVLVVLMLAAMVPMSMFTAAAAWNFADGVTIFFDNSQLQWSQPYFAIGHGSWHTTTAMTRVGETDYWRYTQVGEWGGAEAFKFTAASGQGGSSIYTFAPDAGSTGVYGTHPLTGALFVPTAGVSGSPIEQVDPSTGGNYANTYYNKASVVNGDVYMAYGQIPSSYDAGSLAVTVTKWGMKPFYNGGTPKGQWTPFYLPKYAVADLWISNNQDGANGDWEGVQVVSDFSPAVPGGSYSPDGAGMKSTPTAATENISSYLGGTFTITSTDVTEFFKGVTSQDRYIEYYLSTNTSTPIATSSAVAASEMYGTATATGVKASDISSTAGTYTIIPLICTSDLYVRGEPFTVTLSEATPPSVELELVDGKGTFYAGQSVAFTRTITNGSGGAPAEGTWTITKHVMADVYEVTTDATVTGSGTNWTFVSTVSKIIGQSYKVRYTTGVDSNGLTGTSQEEFIITVHYTTAQQWWAELSGALTSGTYPDPADYSHADFTDFDGTSSAVFTDYIAKYNAGKTLADGGLPAYDAANPPDYHTAYNELGSASFSFTQTLNQNHLYVRSTRRINKPGAILENSVTGAREEAVFSSDTATQGVAADGTTPVYLYRFDFPGGAYDTVTFYETVRETAETSGFLNDNKLSGTFTGIKPYSTTFYAVDMGPDSRYDGWDLSEVTYEGFNLSWDSLPETQTFTSGTHVDLTEIYHYSYSGAINSEFNAHITTTEGIQNRPTTPVKPIITYWYNTGEEDAEDYPIDDPTAFLVPGTTTGTGIIKIKGNDGLAAVKDFYTPESDEISVTFNLEAAPFSVAMKTEGTAYALPGNAENGKITLVASPINNALGAVTYSFYEVVDEKTETYLGTGTLDDKGNCTLDYIYAGTRAETTKTFKVYATDADGATDSETAVYKFTPAFQAGETVYIDIGDDWSTSFGGGTPIIILDGENPKNGETTVNLGLTDEKGGLIPGTATHAYLEKITDRLWYYTFTGLVTHDVFFARTTTSNVIYDWSQKLTPADYGAGNNWLKNDDSLPQDVKVVAPFAMTVTPVNGTASPTSGTAPLPITISGGSYTINSVGFNGVDVVDEQTPAPGILTLLYQLSIDGGEYNSLTTSQTENTTYTANAAGTYTFATAFGGVVAGKPFASVTTAATARSSGVTVTVTAPDTAQPTGVSVSPTTATIYTYKSLADLLSFTVSATAVDGGTLEYSAAITQRSGKLGPEEGTLYDATTSTPDFSALTAGTYTITFTVYNVVGGVRSIGVPVTATVTVIDWLEVKVRGINGAAGVIEHNNSSNSVSGVANGEFVTFYAKSGTVVIANSTVINEDYYAPVDWYFDEALTEPLGDPWRLEGYQFTVTESVTLVGLHLPVFPIETTIDTSACVGDYLMTPEQIAGMSISVTPPSPAVYFDEEPFAYYEGDEFSATLNGLPEGFKIKSWSYGNEVAAGGTNTITGEVNGPVTLNATQKMVVTAVIVSVNDYDKKEAFSEGLWVDTAENVGGSSIALVKATNRMGYGYADEKQETKSVDMWGNKLDGLPLYTFYLPANAPAGSIPLYFGTEIKAYGDWQEGKKPDYTAIGNGFTSIQIGAEKAEVTYYSGDSIPYTLNTPILVKDPYANNAFYIQFMQSDSSALYINTEEGKTLDKLTTADKKKAAGTYLAVDKEVAGDPTTDSVKTMKQIKGRGNSSFQMSLQLYGKTAFNVSFDDNAALFGMPEGKKWSLLANNNDSTSERNMVIFDLAREMGLPYTPEYESVDMYINGEYQGTYLVVQKVDLGKKSLFGKDFKVLDDANEELNALPSASDPSMTVYEEATDATLTPGKITVKIGGVDTQLDAQWVPGLQTPNDFKDYGYVLEFDLAERAVAEASYFVTPQGQHVVVKYPEFCTEEELKYIAERWCNVENEIYTNSADLTNVSHEIDVDTFAKTFLIQELAKNIDSSASSYYVTLQNQQSKFVAAPVWDYDWTLGAYTTDSRPFVFGTHDDTNNQPQNPEGWMVRYKGLHIGDFTQPKKYNFQAQLAQNLEFWDEVEEIWNAENGFFDTAVDYISISPKKGEYEYDAGTGKTNEFAAQIADSMAMNEYYYKFIQKNPSAGWGTTNETIAATTTKDEKSGAMVTIIDESYVGAQTNVGNSAQRLDEWIYDRLAWMDARLFKVETSVYVDPAVVAKFANATDPGSPGTLGQTIRIGLGEEYGGSDNAYWFTDNNKDFQVYDIDTGTYYTAKNIGYRLYEVTLPTTTTKLALVGTNVTRGILVASDLNHYLLTSDGNTNLAGTDVQYMDYYPTNDTSIIDQVLPGTGTGNSADGEGDYSRDLLFNFYYDFGSPSEEYTAGDASHYASVGGDKWNNLEVVKKSDGKYAYSFDSDGAHEGTTFSVTLRYQPSDGSAFSGDIMPGIGNIGDSMPKDQELLIGGKYLITLDASGNVIVGPYVEDKFAVGDATANLQTVDGESKYAAMEGAELKATLNDYMQIQYEGAGEWFDYKGEYVFELYLAGINTPVDRKTVGPEVYGEELPSVIFDIDALSIGMNTYTVKIFPTRDEATFVESNPLSIEGITKKVTLYIDTHLSSWSSRVGGYGSFTDGFYLYTNNADSENDRYFKMDSYGDPRLGIYTVTVEDYLLTNGYYFGPSLDKLDTSYVAGEYLSGGPLTATPYQFFAVDTRDWGSMTYDYYGSGREEIIPMAECPGITYNGHKVFYGYTDTGNGTTQKSGATRIGNADRSDWIAFDINYSDVRGRVFVHNDGSIYGSINELEDFNAKLDAQNATALDNKKFRDAAAIPFRGLSSVQFTETDVDGKIFLLNSNESVGSKASHVTSTMAPFEYSVAKDGGWTKFMYYDMGNEYQPANSDSKFVIAEFADHTTAILTMYPENDANSVAKHLFSGKVSETQTGLDVRFTFSDSLRGYGVDGTDEQQADPSYTAKVPFTEDWRGYHWCGEIANTPMDKAKALNPSKVGLSGYVYTLEPLDYTKNGRSAWSSINSGLFKKSGTVDLTAIPNLEDLEGTPELAGAEAWINSHKGMSPYIFFDNSTSQLKEVWLYSWIIGGAAGGKVDPGEDVNSSIIERLGGSATIESETNVPLTKLSNPGYEDIYYYYFDDADYFMLYDGTVVFTSPFLNWWAYGKEDAESNKGVDGKLIAYSVDDETGANPVPFTSPYEGINNMGFLFVDRGANFGYSYMQTVDITDVDIPTITKNFETSYADKYYPTFQTQSYQETGNDNDPENMKIRMYATQFEDLLSMPKSKNVDFYVDTNGWQNVSGDKIYITVNFHNNISDFDDDAPGDLTTETYELVRQGTGNIFKGNWQVPYSVDHTNLQDEYVLGRILYDDISISITGATGTPFFVDIPGLKALETGEIWYDLSKNHEAGSTAANTTGDIVSYESLWIKVGTTNGGTVSSPYTLNQADEKTGIVTLGANGNYTFRYAINNITKANSPFNIVYSTATANENYFFSYWERKSSATAEGSQIDSGAALQATVRSSSATPEYYAHFSTDISVPIQVEYYNGQPDLHGAANLLYVTKLLSVTIRSVVLESTDWSELLANAIEEAYGRTPKLSTVYYNIVFNKEDANRSDLAFTSNNFANGQIEFDATDSTFSAQPVLKIYSSRSQRLYNVSLTFIDGVGDDAVIIPIDTGTKYGYQFVESSQDPYTPGYSGVAEGEPNMGGLQVATKEIGGKIYYVIDTTLSDGAEYVSGFANYDGDLMRSSAADNPEMALAAGQTYEWYTVAADGTETVLHVGKDYRFFVTEAKNIFFRIIDDPLAALTESSTSKSVVSPPVYESEFTTMLGITVERIKMRMKQTITVPYIHERDEETGEIVIDPSNKQQDPRDVTRYHGFYLVECDANGVPKNAQLDTSIAGINAKVAQMYASYDAESGNGGSSRPKDANTTWIVNTKRDAVSKLMVFDDLVTCNEAGEFYGVYSLGNTAANLSKYYRIYGFHQYENADGEWINVVSDNYVIATFGDYTK